jgi:D-lactate dehydrogenase
MNIIAYDLVQKRELIAAFDVEYTEMDEVLKQADILTLHLPYTEDNYHMISYEQIEMMKDNSYLVNVSRGEVVDTNAYLNLRKKVNLRE